MTSMDMVTSMSGCIGQVLASVPTLWRSTCSLKQTVESGKMNLAISGVMLLTFMTIHLFQFRFGDTVDFYLCPPPYFINLAGILSLNLFWVDTPGCTQIPVRDIYRLEFEIFSSLGWCLFYISAVVIFSTHTCLGWQKCVTAASLEIPKRYQNKAAHIGYVMTFFVALVYVSFPVYTHIFSMKPAVERHDVNGVLTN